MFNKFKRIKTIQTQIIVSLETVVIIKYYVTCNSQKVYNAPKVCLC